jgi:hypothetical protein
VRLNGNSIVATERENLIQFIFHHRRDAGIREAECEKTAMDVKYSTDTKIEDNSRMYKLQKANFDQEVNTAVSLKPSTINRDRLMLIKPYRHFVTIAES